MKDGFHLKVNLFFLHVIGLISLIAFFFSTEDFQWPCLNGTGDDNTLVIFRGIQSHVMQGFL